MKIVIACDSFKGSLTSLQAGETIRDAILSLYPSFEVSVFPLSDGGEGLLDIMLYTIGGERVSLSVCGPLGTPVDAAYGILRTGTAVIEAAQANGLTLIPAEMRDPLKTTSYGLGQLIADAAGRGCQDFIVGIGGSATNDGGLGMLEALGLKAYDAAGEELGPFGRDLLCVTRLDASNLLPALRTSRFRLACDVDSPLCGERGCSLVFGPQKGGGPEILAAMDAALSSYADLIAEITEHDLRDLPGAGAAGGLGFAFTSFFGSVLESGASLVMAAIGLENAVKEADIVITGEGRLDSQTSMGKCPGAVAVLAKKYGAVCLAFAGQVTADTETLRAMGFDLCFTITSPCLPMEEALRPDVARRNLYSLVQSVFNSDMFKA